MPAVVAVLFWVCAGLLVYTQVGYALALAALARVRRPRPLPASAAAPPLVSLIVAAHAEQGAIAAKVADALALDWPRERLELIVACDGSPDATARLAREAGADLVLELPRVGKVAAQDAAVARSRGELLAFSDANARWERDALRELAAPFADPRVGYACGQVCFVPAGPGAAAANQEGLYWRYEMALRTLESRLSSVTAGNGAIYAVRRDAYLAAGTPLSHDLALPSAVVKLGLRAVYAPGALATEAMVPTLAGERARKRRMASQAWEIVLRGGLLDPRGYPPLYALMIASHRVLRYAAPFLHVAALGLNAALLGDGWVYVATFALQVAALAGALVAPAIRARPLLVARYYVATNASVAIGLLDYLTRGAPVAWGPAEGAR
jgi:cellulose synthase/poly-beta-1,6-N-acetylglucosamine synthase-like glycosyltransferase